MAFTFPVDSNNKAGAVKGKSNGSDFVVPVQETCYDEIEAKRVMLTAATNSELVFTSECLYFDIQNLADAGDVYAKVSAAAHASVVAAEADTAAVLIKAGGGYSFPLKGTKVQLISTETPKIQAIGVRNNEA